MSLPELSAVGFFADRTCVVMVGVSETSFIQYVSLLTHPRVDLYYMGSASCRLITKPAVVRRSEHRVKNIKMI